MIRKTLFDSPIFVVVRRAVTEGSHSFVLQVFELIGQGFETKQIAEQLKLDVKTIETYRARIKEKLGLCSAPALMRAAFQFVQSGSATRSLAAPG